MLTPAEKSFINLEKRKLMDQIASSDNDNLILEKFLKDGKSQDVLMNEHVGLY